MNEAAERLLHLIHAEHGPDFSGPLNEALTAERKATVERIRAKLEHRFSDILAILGAEAAR